MDEQSRPAGAEEGQGAEHSGTAKDAGTAGHAGTKAAKEHLPEVPAAEQTGKLRPAYLDPLGSESTRELRDTARRRRDAEEKLQQHLMEAKHHVPNEFHEHHGHGLPGHGEAGTGHEASHQAERSGAGEESGVEEMSGAEEQGGRRE